MIRDYCFVGDVVKANLMALEKGSGQAFNIGTGVETKTLDLFENIYHVMKERVQLDEGLSQMDRQAARAGDLKKSCLNCQKASDELGWKAEHDLEKGLRKTLDWRLSIR
jgi:UDP-glucose 4-epimerase